MKISTLSITLLAAFLLNVVATNAWAEIKPDYDVPVSEDDVRPDDQPKIDHEELRLKKFKCSDGEEYGLLYKKTWGYSLTTRALGMCSWDNSDSLEECDADMSDESRKCYDEALVKYKLKEKYEKAAAEKEDKSPRIKSSSTTRSATPTVPDQLPAMKGNTVQKRFKNPAAAPSVR